MLAATTLHWVRDRSESFGWEVSTATYSKPMLKITPAPNFCEKGSRIFHNKGIGRKMTMTFVLIFRTLCHKVTLYMHVSFISVGLIHSAGTITVHTIV